MEDNINESIFRPRKRSDLIKKLEKNPPLFFLFAYILVIGLGGLLLCLPISSQSGQATNLVDSIFVSTSATCVTGLTPVVSGEYWNLFGQIVIIILIQLGGLGVMTAVAMLGLISGQYFSLSNRKVLMVEKNQPGLTGAIKLIRFILISTFIIEGLGAFLMSFYFVPHYGYLKGIYYAVFHSISAFCNAGFDILGPTSLSPLSSNPYILSIIAGLIIVAGLGYRVYIEIIKYRQRSRLSLHSKIVLSTTLGLIILGSLLIFIFESRNMETLGGMGTFDKWLNSFFQSVTCRTAGFCSFAQEKMTQSGALSSIFLMFIGGSPGGAAGGIKTTTFVAVIISLISSLRSSNDAEIFNRRLAGSSIKSAQTIFIMSILWNCFIVFLLSISEEASLLDLSYETISAYGTVGLSRNLTSNLTDFGKLVISLNMLAGKIGSLTLLHALIPQAYYRKNSLAEERILLG